MITAQQLLSITRSNIIKIDPQARMFSDDELLTFLNDAQRQLEVDAGDEVPEQQKISNWSINTGQQEYVLNTLLPNYKKILYINLPQCDINDISDNLWQVGSYAVYGTSIYTDTIPSTSATYKVFYACTLPEITMLDWCILWIEYWLALWYYAGYLALLSVEKQQKAQDCYGQYKQEVARLVKNIFSRQQYNFINYNS